VPTGESFLSLAEIAIVFAGFAGISMVLGRSQGREFTVANAARLSVMIELSVCTALVSLMPSVLLGFGASAATTWQSSSAVAAVYCLGSAVRGGILRARSVKIVPEEAHGPVALSFVVLLRGVATVSAFVGVFFVTARPGPLFLSLSSNLALSAFLFVGSLWGLREVLENRDRD